MTLEPNHLILEISDKLKDTGNDLTIKPLNLGEYGTSYEITGSDRKLILTPTEDNLIDMILYDETGNTIASSTLFEKAVKNITPEELAILITICL